MPTILAVPTSCPKCGGQGLWDNRKTKTNPKAPDFKCKNKACDGVVWSPRNGQVWADMAAPAPQPTQGYNIGSPAIPQADAPALSHGQMVTEKLNDLMGAYDLCFTHAASLAKRVSGPDTVVTIEGISAIAATIFIAAKDNGLV